VIESLPRPVRGLVHFVRDFMLALGEHAVYSHAAALAFYLIFSIPPALLGVVALAGMLPVEAWMQSGLEHVDVAVAWVYGRFLDPAAAAAAADATMIGWAPITDTLRDLDQQGILRNLREFLQRNAPPAVEQTVFRFVRDVLGNAQPGLLTVGFLGVLWSASGVTRQVLRAVNAIHELRPRPWWRQNLVSLGMTLALLTCGTLFLIGLPLAGALMEAVASQSTLLIAWRIVAGLAALYLLYCVMQQLYRWAVNAKLPASRRREGVILTIVLWGTLIWVLGRWGQEGLDRYSATYGALASIVFLLFWIYSMAISLLLGVEWNATRLSQGPLWETILGDKARPYTRRAAERSSFARGPWGERSLDSPTERKTLESTSDSEPPAPRSNDSDS
jgi:membrane protein